MLKNPAARDRTIQNLLQFVQKNHLAGISIDFEDAPPDSQPGLQVFMQDLYARFHPLGLEVAQAVSMVDAAIDGPAYVKLCHYGVAVGGISGLPIIGVGVINLSGTMVGEFGRTCGVTSKRGNPNRNSPFCASITTVYSSDV